MSVNNTIIPISYSSVRDIVMDLVMSREKFYVVYDGPILAESEMDAKFLAPALLALSEAVEEANLVINGNKAKVHLKVNASFKSGCFGIELSTLVSVIDQTKNLFSNVTLADAKSILDWIGLTTGITGISVFSFIKWVKGRKITKVVPILETNTCTVYIDDEHRVVENEVIALYRNVKFRESLIGILSPLKQDGINEFAVSNNPQDRKFVIIKKDDVTNFEIKEQESILSDRTYETNLQIVGLSFQENNKWKFSDGNAVFHAVILDEQFIKDLNASLLNFSKGDVILADVRQIQAVKNGQIKSEYEIVKVKNIIKALQQLKIPLNSE